ncbi:MAG: hypothetical protein JWM59_1993 [Verrucomicrobiales bacterium]|nr:hypothetical protein [Verrucomicrobiales bacterium]
MSAFVSMIVPNDRPISWLQYVNEELTGLDVPEVADGLLADCDAILLAAAETLGIHPADIYRAAWTGRVEWESPFTAGRTDPVYARLDRGPWVLQPGIRNGVPPSSFIHPAGRPAA